jgi:recombination protein RecA
VVTEKEKLIVRTVDAINETFGAGAAQTLDDAFEPNKIKGFLPTGNLAIDWVIGKPGIPLGRVSEIAGRYGSGKSSIVARIIGQVQAAGGMAVLVDAEHSYDPSWGRLHKVKPEELIYLDPPHLEGAFDQSIAAIKTIRKVSAETPVFIAIDSVSANPTAAELELEDSTASKQAAEHAKIIALGLRRASGLIHKENVALLFVSQLKDNPRASWGNTTHKIGGSAIDFSAGLELEVTRTAFKTDGENKNKVGQTIQVVSKKNKFNPAGPYRVRTFDLYYNEGFRSKEILLDFLLETDLKLVTYKGGWYEYEGAKYRKEDLAPKLDDELFKLVYDKLGIGG